MGGPRPDSVAMPPAAMIAYTLAEVAAAGWILRRRCNRCGLELRTSVGVLIRLEGPDKILWGDHPPCPRLCEGTPCSGKLTYFAQAIRGGSWSQMNAATTRDVEMWQLRRTPGANRYRKRETPADV